MSAEKWESVTWDLIEREIVEYILIPGKKTYKGQSFLNRLAKASELARPSQKSTATYGRSTNNA